MTPKLDPRKAWGARVADGYKTGLRSPTPCPVCGQERHALLDEPPADPIHPTCLGDPTP